MCILYYLIEAQVCQENDGNLQWHLKYKNFVKAFKYNGLPWAIIISNPDALLMGEHWENFLGLLKKFLTSFP